LPLFAFKTTLVSLTIRWLNLSSDSRHGFRHCFLQLAEKKNHFIYIESKELWIKPNKNKNWLKPKENLV
jgi:hypothetical protein